MGIGITKPASFLRRARAEGVTPLTIYVPREGNQTQWNLFI